MTCPGCGEPMDAEAVRFWRTEPKVWDALDWQNLTCTKCYYAYELGTRTPTAAAFVAAGWPIPKGIA